MTILKMCLMTTLKMCLMTTLKKVTFRVEIFMKNQELFCSHPNIVRSCLKMLNDSNIHQVQIPAVLVEAEYDLNIKLLKNDPIFADILCKYHHDLRSVNGKHPFSWAIADILVIWPKIIDYLSFTIQTEAHLLFLKEFILDIFSSYEYVLVQFDLIELFKTINNTFLIGIMQNVVDILPKTPISSFFTVAQKLISLHHEQFVMILLDQILTRFEMGYPIIAMSQMITNLDLEFKYGIALIVSAAYILGKSLDKPVIKLWVAILRTRLHKSTFKQDYVIVLQRILLWPLIKIETDKSCEKGNFVIIAPVGLAPFYFEASCL